MFFKLTVLGMLLGLVLGVNINTDLMGKSRSTRNSADTPINGQTSLDLEHAHVNRTVLNWWYKNQITLTSLPDTESGFKDEQTEDSTSGDVNDGPASVQDPANSHEDTTSPTVKPKKKAKSKNKLRKQRGKSEKGNSQREKGIGDQASSITDDANNGSPETTVASIDDNITQSSEQQLGGNPAAPLQAVSNDTLTQLNSATQQSNANTSMSSSAVLLSTQAPAFGNTTVNGSEIQPAFTSEPIPSTQPTIIVLLVLLTLATFIGLGVWWGWWRMKRRQQERLRLQLLPVYNYDPADDQDDWENRLLGESTGLRPKDKVVISPSSAVVAEAV